MAHRSYYYFYYNKLPIIASSIITILTIIILTTTTTTNKAKADRARPLRSSKNRITSSQKKEKKCRHINSHCCLQPCI